MVTMPRDRYVGLETIPKAGMRMKWEKKEVGTYLGKKKEKETIEEMQVMKKMTIKKKK